MAITTAFIKYQNDYCEGDEHISTASKEEVAKLIEDGKTFNTREIVALFFRNEPDLLEAYMAKHEIRF